MTAVSFMAGSDKIAGNLFWATEPKRLAFLLIHGWQGHQNLDAAQALANLGFTSLTYDMRGNGESDGDIAKLSRADYIHDAEIAYDYLKQQLDPGTEIAVVGSSFGSYIAVLLSKDRPVSALSLRVPASYPDKGLNDPRLAQAESAEMNTWREKSLHYTENRAFQALHDFNGAVQIVEAERDEQVPHQAVQNHVNAVSDQSKLDYRLLANAPHRLENDQLREEYIALLTNWAGQLSLPT